LKIRNKAILLIAVFALIVAACSDDSDDTTTTAAGGEETTTTAAEETTTTAGEETTTTGAEETTSSVAALDGSGTLICQVTDTGGVDDRSFNASAWKGVLDAEAAFGIEPKVLESQTEADYATNLASLVEEGCDLIFTIGFLLGDATAVAAEANPDVPFSIVDFAYDPEITNVRAHVYATAEAAFLAGYAAAALTETGVLGTYGGIDVGPAVTDFMDGYVWGARYYNEQNGTDVQVLGWDPDTKEGVFVGNFESVEDGRTTGQSLADEGADIIMPVAGPVGQGTAAVAQEQGNLLVVGVDSDWFISNPQYSDVILTSVLKKIDASVFQTIEAFLTGEFAGGTTVNTLDNDGVGLAPFHDFESDVSAELVAELEEIAVGIVDGSIDIEVPGS
jgi:basic membrane protein A